MLIKTKYDIGYNFWVPRVRNWYETIKMVDDNGVEWQRSIAPLQVYTKNRYVHCINVDASLKEVKTFYGCRNVGNFTNITTNHTEDEMIFQTEEEALKFARYWRDTEGTQYFGTLTE